ncbi:DUF7024 domain-containing protein [Lysobacter sp. TAF61]|uniref:ArnT family glycosyltransferase n=1 Tax=Lysobacter sp. TAF61 TaxID=3233072 RepID=UPI003F97286D
MPLMLVAAVLLCAYLLLRNAGLYLSVPDEWVYSKSARLLALDVVGVPSYLYFLAFKGTNVCGTGFLDCTRMLNVVFLVSALPFVYLVCRRVASKPVSLLVAILALLGPINTYTAYFMPESMYLLMFWVLAWLALKGSGSRPFLYGMTLGAVLAMMGLVKAHAIFLLPAVMAFVAGRFAVLRHARPATSALMALAGLVIAALVVRFGLGYLLAGPSGLSLFGQVYGSVTPSSQDEGRALRLVIQGLLSLKGHAMALAALYALPLAAVFYFPPRSEGSAAIRAECDQVRLFTFFVFACLLAMTTLFTANVAGSNAMESIARLHMRYYNFAIPLLLVVVAGQISPSTIRPGIRGALPAAAFGVLAILAITGLLDGFVPGIVDSPELRGLTISPVVFRVMAALGVVTMVTWIFNAKVGSRVFLFALFPLVVAISGWRANGELRQAMVADSYASAGIFARQYIGRSVEPTLVVGADHSASYRAMFYLDNPNATNVVIPEGEIVPDAKVPGTARWLLVIGEHALPASAREQAQFGGFTLARLGPEVQSIDFTAGSWPGVISSKQGLSSPEPWGTWSDGTRVVLQFSNPLPREFTLLLKGHTIGDTNEPIGVVVGTDRREIRLPQPQELSLDYSTDGNQRAIAFEIPWAKSMKELRISEDPRRLGIGFVSLQVTSRAPASPAPKALADQPAETEVTSP